MASFSFCKVDGCYYARIVEKGLPPSASSGKTTQKMTAQKRLNPSSEGLRSRQLAPWKGSGLSPVPVLLENVIDAFLQAKEHLRPRTQDTYAGILRRFREEVPPGCMLQDVVADDLKQYIRDSDITCATQHKRFRHFQSFSN